MSGLADWIRSNKAKAGALGGGSLLVLLIVVGAVAGPGEDTVEEVTGEESPTPTLATAEPTPSAPTVTPSGRSPAGAPGPPSMASGAEVVRVIDGDTVVLDGVDVGEIDRATGGRRARLIGVDTPEISGGVECYGREASSFTRGELRGNRVLVDFDVQRTDRYGRALVYLWTPDGAFFNARLAADGYAQQATVPPNVRYAELFTRIVREAREADEGLWGGCPAETDPGEPGVTTGDRDCSDFSTQDEAQRFFEQEGGPQQDPHRLDADDDGVACESLPNGSGTSATPGPTPAPTPAPTAEPTPEPTEGEDCHPSYPDFCIPPPPPDLNCDDMDRKNFTVRHDVPDPDPHGFDGNKDGVGCES